MVILEKFEKKYQIWTKNDEEILVTTFACRRRHPDISIKSNRRLVISNNLHSR
jgi:hypothetical protein